MQIWQIAALLAVVAVVGAGAYVYAAKDEAQKSEWSAGDEAPDVVLIDGDPSTKLSDYEGEKHVLLAFYPKADTPGCTKQMCSYRDDFAKFTEAGVEVFAISLDKQKASDAFKEKYELPFHVVGDSEGEIVKAFSVPKTMGVFAARSIYLIDKQGKLAYINRNYTLGKDEGALYDAIAHLEETAEEEEHMEPRAEEGEEDPNG